MKIDGESPFTTSASTSYEDKEELWQECEKIKYRFKKYLNHKNDFTLESEADVIWWYAMLFVVVIMAAIIINILSKIKKH